MTALPAWVCKATCRHLRAQWTVSFTFLALSVWVCAGVMGRGDKRRRDKCDQTMRGTLSSTPFARASAQLYPVPAGEVQSPAKLRGPGADLNGICHLRARLPRPSGAAADHRSGVAVCRLPKMVSAIIGAFGAWAFTTCPQARTAQVAVAYICSSSCLSVSEGSSKRSS